jgi:hypothetical protein
MKTACSLLAASVVLFAAASTGTAQERGRDNRMFSTDALRRAVESVPLDAAAQTDPRGNWAEVRRLAPSTEIVVTARGMPARDSRFVSADDATLTVTEAEDGRRVTRQISRDDVQEIRRWTGRRGSRLGAAIGAGAGAFLGFLTAVNLATRDCGGDCSDEKFLMGLSLVGMPVGGGLAGYYLPGGRRTLTTVYVRP